MKCLREITKWEGNTPNHIYLLTDNKEKMIAYVKEGTTELFVFGAPRGFETRGRKFVEVPNTFGYVEPTVEVEVVQKWEFTGSKGETHTVKMVDDVLQCTCSGFRFRGKCKHIDEVNAK
jgi:hypothetical protein